MIQKPTEEPITVLSPNEQLEYHNTTGEFQKRKIDASIYSIIMSFTKAYSDVS